MTQLSPIEWLVWNIQSLHLQSLQLASQITLKEKELAELPEVIRLNEEIRELKISQRKAQEKEIELRDTWKKILLDSWMKEFTTLDGTTVAVQFTPWALVIDKEAVVPPQYFREKTTVEVDKVGLKRAITDGEVFEWIYIQKDSKLVVKTK